MPIAHGKNERQSLVSVACRCLCHFVKMFFFFISIFVFLSRCFYFLISSLCQDGEEDGEMETVAAKMSSDRSCQVGQKTKRPN